MRIFSLFCLFHCSLGLFLAADLQPPPLLPALLAAAADLPLPPAFDPTAPTPPAATADNKGKSTKGQKLGFGGSSGKVTPAWMKLGGKSGSEFALPFPCALASRPRADGDRRTQC